MSWLGFFGRRVLPRLLLVIVAVAGLQYGLGQVARRLAVRSARTTVSANLELAGARVSLLDRRVLLEDVRLSIPSHTSASLIQADRCELDLAMPPLLRKRTIIERGRIHGLRIESCSSGEETRAAAPDWLAKHAAGPTHSWFAQVGRCLNEPQPGEFESLRRSEALGAQWAGQREALARRIAELRQRGRELDEGTDAAEANRLRYAGFFQQLPEKIAAVQQDFAAFEAELDDLSASLEKERRIIVAARQRDEQQFREELQLPAVDSTALTEYLLREQLAGPLNELVGWLRWARQAVPASSPAAPPAARGEDVVFAGCRAEPSFLIRSLELEGSANLGGRIVELSGILSDLSNLPARHSAPMRLRLRGTGSVPIDLQATIDRTGPVPRDELLLDCPQVALPEMRLAESGDVALTIAPSVGSLSVSAALSGEELCGEIQLVQKQTRILPVVQGELSGLPLAEPLQATLGKLDSIATRVSLRGTLEEPSCTLWSNLGPAVAEAMHRALYKASERNTESVLADVRREVDERLAKLQRQLAEARATYSGQLAGLSRELDLLARRQTVRDRISVEQLGRRLPANSLFR